MKGCAIVRTRSHRSFSFETRANWVSSENHTDYAADCERIVFVHVKINFIALQCFRKAPRIFIAISNKFQSTC